MKNTILFFRYVILIGYLCCLLPLHAQKRTVLALRDTLTGKDSILLHVSLAESSPQKRQYSIAVKTDKLLSQEYTPAQVPLYREGSQNYLSRILWTQGIKRQVFLPRILWQVRDTLSVFLFINDRKQKEYYTNSGKFLFVPYTKGFGRITHFLGNDLATVLYTAFFLDLLFK